MRTRGTSPGLRAILLVIAAVLLLSACEPPANTSAGTRGDRVVPVESTQTRERPGCDSASGLAGAVLPNLDDEIYERAKANPCLPFADLYGVVTDLVPEAPTRDPRAFHHKVRIFANQVTAINDALTCGYETDRLAIAIYQQKAHRWSAGVVVVVRGLVDELVEGLVGGIVCQLRKLIGVQSLEPAPGTTPELDPCMGLRHPKAGRQTFTVLWIGSSNLICAELNKRIAR